MTGYGLDDQNSIPDKTRDFSLLYVQVGSEATKN
jgi:hypothetical protein